MGYFVLEFLPDFCRFGVLIGEDRGYISYVILESICKL